MGAAMGKGNLGVHGANLGANVVGMMVGEAIAHEVAPEPGTKHDLVVAGVGAPTTGAILAGVNVARGVGAAAALGTGGAAVAPLALATFTGLRTTAEVGRWAGKPASEGGLGMGEQEADAFANTVGWGTAGAAGAATAAAGTVAGGLLAGEGIAASMLAGGETLAALGPAGVVVGAIAGGVTAAIVGAATHRNLEQRINTAIVDQGRAQFVAAHREVDAAAAARTYNQALRYQSNVTNALSTWQHNDPYGYAAAAYRYAAMHPTE